MYSIVQNRNAISQYEPTILLPIFTDLSNVILFLPTILENFSDFERFSVCRKV